MLVRVMIKLKVKCYFKFKKYIHEIKDRSCVSVCLVLIVHNILRCYMFIVKHESFLTPHIYEKSFFFFQFQF